MTKRISYAITHTGRMTHMRKSSEPRWTLCGRLAETMPEWWDEPWCTRCAHVRFWMIRNGKIEGP